MEVKDITDRCMNNLAQYTTIYPVHDEICERVLGTVIDVKTNNSPTSQEGCAC